MFHDICHPGVYLSMSMCPLFNIFCSLPCVLTSQSPESSHFIKESISSNTSKSDLALVVLAWVNRHFLLAACVWLRLNLFSLGLGTATHESTNYTRAYSSKHGHEYQKHIYRCVCMKYTCTTCAYWLVDCTCADIHCEDTCALPHILQTMAYAHFRTHVHTYIHAHALAHTHIYACIYPRARPLTHM